MLEYQLSANVFSASSTVWFLSLQDHVFTKWWEIHLSDSEYYFSHSINRYSQLIEWHSQGPLVLSLKYEKNIVLTKRTETRHLEWKAVFNHDYSHLWMYYFDQTYRIYCLLPYPYRCDTFTHILIMSIFVISVLFHKQIKTYIQQFRHFLYWYPSW